jgi:hypothetical protein
MNATDRIALALSLVNLTEDDDAYRAIVDPFGTPSEEAAVAHDASSCMLVAAWLDGWRGRFVPDTIQNTLRAMWHGTGRIPDVDNFCEEGSALWWAASATAEEHVDACVVNVVRHELAYVTLTVVAGGQRLAGKRAILQLDRRVAWDDRYAAWVDQANGRHIRGVLDAT